MTSSSSRARVRPLENKATICHQRDANRYQATRTTDDVTVCVDLEGIGGMTAGGFCRRAGHRHGRKGATHGSNGRRPCTYLSSAKLNRDCARTRSNKEMILLPRASSTGTSKGEHIQHTVVCPKGIQHTDIRYHCHCLQFMAKARVASIVDAVPTAEVIFLNGLQLR